MESDDDGFVLSARDAFKDKFVLASLVAPNSRELHSGLAVRTKAVKQRIVPPCTRIGVLQLILPSGRVLLHWTLDAANREPNVADGCCQ